MSNGEHADIWRKVSDQMEKHAENKTATNADQRVLAALGLFAWEVSQAYRMKQFAADHPEAAR